MNYSRGKKQVLIAPLDWGLGHATRCIPIVRFFQEKNWHIIVACPLKSPIYFLLKGIFPEIEYRIIHSYNIHYQRGISGFKWKILTQIPKIAMAATKDYFWLKRYLKNHSIPDIIISDNRLGFFSEQAFSVYMTHQLRIKIANKYIEKIAQSLHYAWIDRYDACWVPDLKAAPGLAGLLSHPTRLPRTPVTYIGLLNRFQKIKTKEYTSEHTSINKDNNILALISGPEPQRSLLEQALTTVLPVLGRPFVIVQGKPSAKSEEVRLHGGLMYNHLPQDQLEKLIAQSAFVIGRSGYTSVMELLALQKKCIFIPTPGQTEQEYIADNLMRSKLAYCFAQDSKDWRAELIKGFHFSFQKIELPPQHLYDTLETFMKNNAD